MSKNPLVSIIIPTRNSEEFIKKCLDSIGKQTYKNIEVLVIDNKSSDKTKTLSSVYTDLVFNKGPERSAQRNYGAKKSKGKFLLFIDSDMELDKKVVEECVHACLNHKNAAGVIIPEESYGEGFWAQCKKLERSFYIGVDWMEAARFFRRYVFDEMKGYDEKNTGTEDYDLPQRIKQKYGNQSILRITKFIYHNEANLSLRKTLSKKYYYAQKLDAYKNKKVNERHLLRQANLLERYILYFSNPKKLFSNPLIAVGMLFMKTCEILAGGTGYILRKRSK